MNLLGGLLSNISFMARPPSALGQAASGVIDLRVFDETFNRPQGEPLGTIPFSGTFEFDPNDPFNRRLNIELDNLESLVVQYPAIGWASILPGRQQADLRDRQIGAWDSTDSPNI